MAGLQVGDAVKDYQCEALDAITKYALEQKKCSVLVVHGLSLASIRCAVIAEECSRCVIER